MKYLSNNMTQEINSITDLWNHIKYDAPDRFLLYPFPHTSIRISDRHNKEEKTDGQRRCYGEL